LSSTWAVRRENNGNIVRPALGIGPIDEALGRGVHVAARRLQDFGYLRVAHDVRESVGAKQIKVASAYGDGGGIGFDARLHAQGARQQIFAQRFARLLRRVQAAVYQFLHDGVVFGELLQRAAAQTVQARIADVAQIQPVVIEHGYDHRRTHAPVVRTRVGGLIDRAVGHLDGIGYRHELAARRRGAVFAAGALRAVAEVAGDDIDRHAAGHFPRLVPAHAIGEDRQAPIRLRGDAILVLIPHPPAMRQPSHDQSPGAVHDTQQLRK